jgi:Na+/phosphate symporter|tara:strand:- start:87 stop:506 length:420 start_codon:yes stop_codon:yes gene_type:complete
MSKNDYQVFGLNSIKISVIYGIFLIVFAVFVSAASGSRSLTSYIPAMLGLPILFLGLVAFAAPSKQKLVMHVNVVIGLIIFLSGLSVIGSLASGTPLTSSFWANLSRLFLSISGALYLTFCVKSFIFIRKQKRISAAIG